MLNFLEIKLNNKIFYKLYYTSKNLTHHLARHTFATTVCLSNGISMEATSGMLGHATMRTTQIYGKILPKRISNEMQKLKAKMNSEGAAKIELLRKSI